MMVWSLENYFMLSVIISFNLLFLLFVIIGIKNPFLFKKKKSFLYPIMIKPVITWVKKKKTSFSIKRHEHKRVELRIGFLGITLWWQWIMDHNYQFVISSSSYMICFSLLIFVIWFLLIVHIYLISFS